MKLSEMSGPLTTSSYWWPSPVPSGCRRSVCARLKFSMSRARVEDSAEAATGEAAAAPPSASEATMLRTEATGLNTAAREIHPTTA